MDKHVFILWDQWAEIKSLGPDDNLTGFPHPWPTLV